MIDVISTITMLDQRTRITVDVIKNVLPNEVR